jgi:hypothetical protein
MFSYDHTLRLGKQLAAPCCDYCKQSATEGIVLLVSQEQTKLRN